jgi:hypothetical protein
VELDSQPSRRADPLHDKLRFGDDFLARITGLAVASTSPDAGDTVLGQTTIGELASNQATEGFLFHGDEGSSSG